MDLYLVRHGETAANQRHEYQPPNEPLSSSGATEVARLVRRIQNIDPTHIYTSDFKRARETAHFFGYSTGIEPVWLPTIHEVYPPEYIIGRSHYGPSSLWYMVRWFFNAFDDSRHHKAETRDEFIARVLAARQHFEETHTQGDRVVAVTHSVFMNFFVAHLCTHDRVSVLQALPLFFKILLYENSGVTHVRYIGETEKNVCPWQLVSHNNHDHLEV